MARRRLIAPDTAEVERLRAEAAGAARARTTPPVAQVAGDAADAHSRAFAEAMTQAAAFAKASAEGLVLRHLPLDVVEGAHLTRDRLDVDPEDLRELKASIAEHGLRTAVEVTPLADSPGRFGLISGWRRLLALKELHAETGEAAFAVVKAVVRETDSARAAYVAMVEENEIRSDLSFYERGRIAAVAADLGVFASPAAAVDALFTSASPAKRSKIRSFTRIHDSLGGTLTFPTRLGERLGLRVAAALDRVSADELGAALERAGPFADPTAEQEALAALIEQVETVAARREAEAPSRPRRGRPPTAKDSRAASVIELHPGVQLERHWHEDRLELRLTGSSLTDELADAAADALRRVFADVDVTVQKTAGS